MTDFDPVEFGRSVGETIRDAVTPLLRRIEELESRQPEKGDKGDRGDDAPPVEIDVADVVRELLAADGVKQYLKLEVDAYLTENPPANGKDATEAQIIDAVKSALAANPPKDGKSVTIEDVSLFLDAAIAKHVLELERRATDAVTKAIDKIPEPKQGRDGVDLTELSIDFDGERTVTVKGRTGEVTKRVPVPLWRGYWSPGVVAEKADILTHNGTAYIAIVDNPKCEPGVGKYDHEWKVFARKGADGKHGRNGIDKTAPVKVNGNA